MDRRWMPAVVLLAALTLPAGAFAQTAYVGTTFTQGMTPVSGTNIWNASGGTSGYTATSFTRGMTALSGDTTIWDGMVTTADDVSQLVNLGFTFQFYGNSYTQVYVSTNGYLTFSATNTTDFSNDAIPDAINTPHDYIGPFWDDLIVQGTNDRVSYMTTGSSPNRVFTVQYLSMSTWIGGTADSLTAQVKLYESTNVIEFQYDNSNQTWSNVSATIGIEDSTGSTGVGGPNTFSTNSTLPATNYRFTPSGGGSGPWDDAAQLVPLGFTFQFYGTGYTQAYVSTNGFLTFTNASATDYTNDAIPSTLTPNNYVALCWDDLIVQNSGFPDRVSYATTGSVGSRVFTVEYNGVSFLAATSSEMTGQIKLYEGTNRIELHYSTTSGANVWSAASATIGIEDSSGSSGVGGPNASNTNASAPTVNYRFDPVSSVTLTVASTYGSPTPAVGTQTYTAGTSVTCSVPSPVAGATTGVQYRCTGWTGTGSVPSSGTGTTVTFTINATSTLTWNWVTEYALTLQVSPSGAGTAVATPNQTWHASGSSVTLTATPNAGNQFANWSGAHSSTLNPDPNFVITAPSTVTATFTVVLCSLTVSSANGSPTPGVGAHSYTWGSSVTCSVPTPAAGPAGTRYLCTGWTGGGSVPGSGPGATVTFTISQNSTITWNWQTEYNLTVQENPAGSGSVALTPTGGWYAAGTAVSLQATPNTGYSFTGWSGALSGTANPGSLTVSAPAAVTADFQPVGPALLVTSAFGAPAPPVGSQAYFAGTQVACSVSSPVAGPPGVRYVCTGWTGTGDVPASGTGTSFTFTINGASTLNWSWQIEYQLTLAANPTGGGVVHSGPAGTWLPANAALTLQAAANSGFTFFSWSGGLAGSDNPAVVLLDAPKTITGNFVSDLGLGLAPGPANPPASIEAVSASGVPVLQVAMTAGGAGDLDVTSVRLSVTGSSDESVTVSAANLYVDADGDGVYTAGTDAVFQTGRAFLADEGAVTFTTLIPLRVHAGSTTLLVATFDLAATAGDDFQARIVSGSDVIATPAQGGAAVVCVGPPVAGGVVTAAAPGSPGSLQVLAGPKNPSTLAILPGMTGQVLGQFALRTGSLEGVTLDALTFSASGSGHDALDITAVRLVRDDNGNGAPDAGEIQLGVEGRYATDDGTVTFASLGQSVAASDTMHVLLICDFSPDLRAGSFRGAIQSPGHVTATGAVSAAAVHVSGTPVHGSLAILTPASGDPSFFMGGCGGPSRGDAPLWPLVPLALAMVLRARARIRRDRCVPPAIEVQ